MNEMTRLLIPSLRSSIAVALVVLAGCGKQPVMTDEPGTRPMGHVLFCIEHPDHDICKDEDDAGAE